MKIEEIIAYEDAHLIVVKKPVGMASQSERGFGEDLLSMVLCYRKQKKEPVYGAVINRLDKPVGGLVLIAKDKKSAASLSAMTGEHSIEKRYYAVVSGVIAQKGEFVDYLQKDGKNNCSKVVTDSTPGAKKARLLYEPVETKEIDGKVYTLVRVRLLTGRHHQIRVQFAARGHALYGDMKYNPDFADKTGYGVTPALYAYHLSFRNPAGADHITVEGKPAGAKDLQGRNIWSFAYFD